MSSKSPSRSTSHRSQRRRTQSLTDSPVELGTPPFQSELETPSAVVDKGKSVDRSRLHPAVEPADIALPLSTFSSLLDIRKPVRDEKENFTQAIEEIPGTFNTFDYAARASGPKRDKIPHLPFRPTMFAESPPDVSETYPGWAMIAQSVREYDENRTGIAKEEVDTLLVFSGLFSAVVTAFLIESYKTLQKQPEDKTTEILARISEQLGSLTILGDVINSTVSPFSDTTSSDSRLGHVVINTLWTLCLILSLAAASLSMFIKQWLDEFMTYSVWDPRQQVILRFYRDAGMVRWRVFKFSAIIRVLLQNALVLFLIGLGLFVHELDSFVGWIAIGCMLGWLAFVLFILFAPIFSAQCPYKTPILNRFLTHARQLFVHLINLINWLVFGENQLRPTFARIRRALKRKAEELNSLEEKELRTSENLDLAALLCVRSILPASKAHPTLLGGLRYHSFDELISAFKTIHGQPQTTTLAPEISRRVVDELLAFMMQAMSLNLGAEKLETQIKEPKIFKNMYKNFGFALSSKYTPSNSPESRHTIMPDDVALRLLGLIRFSHAQAVFAILVMYFVRLHTLMDHPGYYDDLFDSVIAIDFPDEGKMFFWTLTSAMRTIMRAFWLRSSDNLLDDNRSLRSCLSLIKKEKYFEDSPPDILPLIYILAKLCSCRTPHVMEQAELRPIAGLMYDLLGSISREPWHESRKLCLAAAIESFELLESNGWCMDLLKALKILREDVRARG